MALLKPLSESQVTLTAGLRNSMTAADRRCFWRIWKGFDTDLSPIASASLEMNRSLHFNAVTGSLAQFVYVNPYSKNQYI
jgi:hypothetical protein